MTQDACNIGTIKNLLQYQQQRVARLRAEVVERNQTLAQSALARVERVKAGEPRELDPHFDGGGDPEAVKAIVEYNTLLDSIRVLTYALEPK